MSAWRRENLGDDNVFDPGDLVVPAEARFPRRISCARIAYAGKILAVFNQTFIGTDNQRHSIWYWPVAWTSPNTNPSDEDRYEWCSHICFNKLCVLHIILETQLANRSRQYGVQWCKGHIVAEHNYTDDEDCYYIGYSCMHRWGCRNVTPVRVSDEVKFALPRKPWSDLRYRSGEPEFSVANTVIHL